MSLSPKISIIVPIYNTASLSEGASFLRRCVESIINQTYQNIEIVFVDNNSSDDSIEVVRALVEGESRVIVTHENQPGVSCARNKGLSLVAGDYFTFIDSDDYVDLDYVETAVRRINECRADLLVRDFNVMMPDGNVGTTLRTYAYKNLGNEVERIYGYVECAVNIFYSRHVMNDHAIMFDDDIAIGEDNLFNVRFLLNSNNITFCSDCGYYYNVHGASSSRTRSAAYLSFIKAYERIFHLGVTKYGYLHSNTVKYFIKKYHCFINLVDDRDEMKLRAGKLLDLYDLPKDELLRAQKAKIPTKFKSFIRRLIPKK